MDMDDLLGKVVRENKIALQLVAPQIELASVDAPVVADLRKESRCLLQIALVGHQLRRK